MTVRESPGAARLRAEEGLHRNGTTVRQIVGVEPPDPNAPVPMMTEVEARACVSAINRHMDTARTMLLDLYEREGWRALGYDTWRECASVEFGHSFSWVYRQLSSARLEREFSPIGERPPALPESRLREIAAAPAEMRPALVESARQGATARELTLSVSTATAAPVIEPQPPRPSSVVHTDQEALAALFSVHVPHGARVLDVTFNQGRMWKGLPHDPHRFDLDQQLCDNGFTDTVGDFRSLPFGDDSWDVLVFDPPHITDAGQSGLVGGRDGQGWAGRYGTLSDGFTGSSIVACFRPFLEEAARVLVDGGVVLAKIANQVHSAAYQDQARMLKNLAETMGFIVCDEMIKVALSRGGLVDPQWKHVWHVRNVHTYWLVLRRGRTCHR